MATNNTNNSVVISASANGIEMLIKNYTPARYQNFKDCDQKYYYFSADWAEEQEKKICSDALTRAKKIMKYITAFEEDEGWGKKEDTCNVIECFNLLLSKIKLGTDNRANSFTVYQIERYLNRVWYRGTKEQRDAADAALGLTPKTKKTKAEPKTETKTEAAPKTKRTRRAAKTTAAPETKPADSTGLTAEEKALLMKLMQKLCG